MKQSTQVLRSIAMTLGNPIGNFGVPYMVSLLVVGLPLKHFKEAMPGLLVFAIFVIGSLLLAVALMHFYVVINGKRILSAIEKDYGPRTSQGVYKTFAETKEGEKLRLDIPGLARAYGEDK
ncbi:hypothetical protein [Pseudomonas sp. 460]|uniref:hypothetical protein n=1 Tax=Pseudomonas sp. 460 TaxID=2485142 RepID=UPI00105033D6|nr:hypothetical protein [Pseudomonas sp. 460]TCV51342.1 hypothetical protein EDB99_1078 [Pseudomonas sp. 460]